MSKWLQSFMLEPPPPPTASLDSVRMSRLAVRQPCLSAEDFHERAAIIEHEAGIPREWAEAFARVCLMPRPQAIQQKRWQSAYDCKAYDK